MCLSSALNAPGLLVRCSTCPSLFSALTGLLVHTHALFAGECFLDILCEESGDFLVEEATEAGAQRAWRGTDGVKDSRERLPAVRPMPNTPSLSLLLLTLRGGPPSALQASRRGRPARARTGTCLSPSCTCGARPAKRLSASSCGAACDAPAAIPIASRGQATVSPVQSFVASVVLQTSSEFRGPVQQAQARSVPGPQDWLCERGGGAGGGGCRQGAASDCCQGSGRPRPRSIDRPTSAVETAAPARPALWLDTAAVCGSDPPARVVTLARGEPDAQEAQSLRQLYSWRPRLGGTAAHACRAAPTRTARA